MPRGIYDRTKTKAQRAVEKVNKPAAPKKKFKKVKASISAEGLASLEKDLASFTEQQSFNYNDTYLMSEARANLDVLNKVAEKFSDSSTVDAEISAHIEILGRLSKKVFASFENKTEDKVSDSDEETQEEDSSANGVVPLPSLPPVTVIQAR